jgi:hypothetical protein
MASAGFRDYVRLVRGFNTFTRLLRSAWINGYAVGRKVANGRTLNALCISVFVNKKLGLRRLPVASRIPQSIRLPDERSEDGVLEFITDVREARFSSLEYIGRERPARSGISIGHANTTAGTLGGLVRDKVSGNVAILSNNHVLADSNEAVVGDSVLQPGPADGGTLPADRIATLTRFVPIDFSGDAQNRVDCAIATPENAGDVAWNTIDIGPETPQTARVLGADDFGVSLQKSGRTTEHTEGVVDALFATAQVQYDPFRQATFVDQIIASQPPARAPFSDGGDSGSLVYDSDKRVVGSLFAGSQGSDGEPATTIINPINFVLSQLDIGLLIPGDQPSARPTRIGKVSSRSAKGRRKRGR